MNDFLALLGALGGFKAIEWIVTFFVPSTELFYRNT